MFASVFLRRFVLALSFAAVTLTAPAAYENQMTSQPSWRSAIWMSADRSRTTAASNVHHSASKSPRMHATSSPHLKRHSPRSAKPIH